MLLLASTADLLRVTTSAAVNVDVHATWVDLASGVTTPGRTNTPITTATTTTVVASPASSTYRTVKTLAVRNRDASTPCDVTVIHTDGTNAMELVKFTLEAGDVVHYDEHAGFTCKDLRGRVKTRADALVAAAVNTLNTVVLASDVVNNNATANTIADVTGLSFTATSGETYWFRATILYTANASTTGSRWSINGPGATVMAYQSNYPITSTTQTIGFYNANDLPASSNASSNNAGAIAILEGVYTANANGSVICRFASEVASAAITAKAGSILQWVRTL